MTTIGVVGYGVVGQAVAEGFEKQGYEIYANDIDPSKGALSSLDVIMSRCSYVFICVPTPFGDKHTALKSVVNSLANVKTSNSPIIIIKSTVKVGTTRDLANTYPRLHFVYNPEFLREEFADRDFLKPDRIIIGSNNQLDEGKRVASLYLDYPSVVFHTNFEQAEMIKLLSNAYLVYKVAFGLEGDRLCKALGVENSREVLGLVGADKRIGTSHLDPSKGKIPLNSPCLPKDLKALLSQVDSPLLRVAYEGAVE